jgi:hypothetical protein
VKLTGEDQDTDAGKHAMDNSGRHRSKPLSDAQLSGN